MSDARGVGTTMDSNPTPLGIQNGYTASTTSNSDTNTVPFGHYVKTLSQGAFQSGASASQDSQITFLNGSVNAGYGGGNLLINTGAGYSTMQFTFSVDQSVQWTITGGFNGFGYPGTYYGSIDGYDLTIIPPNTGTLAAGVHTFKWGINVPRGYAATYGGVTKSYNFDHALRLSSPYPIEI
jgi:hypothetical protein